MNRNTSPLEAAILRAKVKGQWDKAERLELKAEACPFCSSRWEMGKREYHSETCNL